MFCRLARFNLLVTVLLTVLMGCSFTSLVTQPSMPEEPLYVLAGGNFHHENLDNALYIVDPTEWHIVRRIGLPPGAYEPTLARDPSGRIWIGLGPQEQLLIFSPIGEQIKTLETCENPTGGVYFANNRAFVVCGKRGFTGVIDVFDLDSFELIKSIELLGIDPENPDYLVIPNSGIASTDYVLVTGRIASTSARTLQEPLTIITFINTRTIEIEEQKILEQTIPSDVFLNQGRFYIQNANTKIYPGIEQKTLIEIEPRNTLKHKPLPYFSANQGSIHKMFLYNYHNTYGWSEQPWTALTRINLDTGETEKLWRETQNDENKILPLSVMDMEIIYGKIIFLCTLPQGLIHFDPQSGTATHLLKIPELLSDMLWVEEVTKNE